MDDTIKREKQVRKTYQSLLNTIDLSSIASCEDVNDSILSALYNSNITSKSNIPFHFLKDC